MKRIKLFYALFFGILSQTLFAQSAWQTLRTVEDVCRTYPEQITSLFEALNLDYPGLEKVRDACRANQPVQACHSLLAHYAHPSRILPKEKLPGFSKQPASDAEAILRDTFTFQEVSGKTPRLPDGHLLWTYNGPRDDIEWAWALNRHYPVSSLLSSCFANQNREYAKYIDSFIKSWILCSWPYPATRSNTAMWRGLEVSFRAKTWALVFYGLATTPEISDATRLLILTSLPQHAHYARHFHATGNWLTMEMSGLATIATAWPEFKQSPEWIRYAIHRMVTGMKEQVYPDGAQNELSSSYHHVALNNFSQFAQLCSLSATPLPGYYTQTIQNMWHYLAWTIRPDGFGLLNNDSDRNNNRENILYAAQTHHQPEWAYLASNGKEGLRPAGEPSCFFPWAGQLISRSGFDANAHWSFFDTGPWGAGHQHNDKLHLSVAAYGRDLLVDAGRFAYRGEVAGRFRKYALGSQSHNVTTVDGKGQDAGPAIASSPVSTNQYAICRDFDYASGFFNRYTDLEGTFSHTRSVVYLRGHGWIVADRYETDRPRNIETLWHWHPDCRLTTGANASVSTANEHGNLKIIPVNAEGWKLQEIKGQQTPTIQGWYSSTYNTFEPSPASVYSRHLDSDDTFVWILWPFEKTPPGIQARLLSAQKTHITIRVTEPGHGSWDITVPFLDSRNVQVTFHRD
jgi:hypothetical protein